MSYGLIYSDIRDMRDMRETREIYDGVTLCVRQYVPPVMIYIKDNVYILHNRRGITRRNTVHTTKVYPLSRTFLIL